LCADPANFDMNVMQNITVTSSAIFVGGQACVCRSRQFEYECSAKHYSDLVWNSAGGPAFLWPSGGSPAETFSVTVNDPRATSRSTLHLQDICQQDIKIVSNDGATMFENTNTTAGNCM
jgi:hypothetical protein